MVTCEQRTLYQADRKQRATCALKQDLVEMGLINLSLVEAFPGFHQEDGDLCPAHEHAEWTKCPLFAPE